MIDFKSIPEKEEGIESYLCRGKLRIYREKLYSVYSLTNTANGKRYIGRTKNPRKRAETHITQIRNHRHPYIEGNPEDFEFVILKDKLRLRESSEAEGEYMDMFRTWNPEFGYNFKDTRYQQRGKPTEHCLKEMKDLDIHLRDRGYMTDEEFFEKWG